jgi:aminodeoxyfutalosine deaminase
MGLSEFINAMPKVELHVHLQGATQPETLLLLARRNKVKLPADSVEGIRQWYNFKDFRHFIDVYVEICHCLQNADDLELMAREFLKQQAAQHIVYSEVTYTPALRDHHNGFTFDQQLAALNRANEWAQAELGVSMGVVIDIPRDITPDEGLLYADWAISGYGNGVVAFGLGGYEPGNPPENYTAAFDRVYAAGMPSVPHAGEKAGPESIWSALKVCHAVRIGHGVRCLEDPALVQHLRERQIPLEVSPTSNICLGVFERFEDHALPKLLDAGLYVTMNSDDPPMFNTDLTNEYRKSAAAFGWDVGMVEQLNLNALRASFLPNTVKANMEREFYAEFGRLRKEVLSTG